MPIVPDEKDWTWVLERECPECGFDTAAVDRDELPGRIAATSAAWGAILGGPDVRQRPDTRPGRRSSTPATSVTCSGIYEGRLGRMLTEDDPHYETGTRTSPPSKVATASRTPRWWRES